MMTGYTDTPWDVVIRSDGASVPKASDDYIQWIAAGNVPNPYIPPPPVTVLSQDLMAQFTADDATKIQTAISGNIQLWLLWSAMQAQSAPMHVTNDRFLAGWDALTQVLGGARMSEIAAALDVTIA